MAKLAFVGLGLMGTPMATRLIDMSTVGPETVREVAARLPQGVTLVDAPVRGSVPEATAGRLAIYVGADQPVSTRSSRS
jgi:3-hydroxyisobutyrate dehydrogenase-like beta-hydroxyacid dehydrogenase